MQQNSSISFLHSIQPSTVVRIDIFFSTPFHCAPLLPLSLPSLRRFISSFSAPFRPFPLHSAPFHSVPLHEYELLAEESHLCQCERWTVTSTSAYTNCRQQYQNGSKIWYELLSSIRVGKAVTEHFSVFHCIETRASISFVTYKTRPLNGVGLYWGLACNICSTCYVLYRCHDEHRWPHSSSQLGTLLQRLLLHTV